MHVNAKSQQQAGARFVINVCVYLLSLLLLCVLFERSLTVCEVVAATTDPNIVLHNYNSCPDKCTCKNTSETVRLLRVKCGGITNQRLTSLVDLQFSQDATNIVYLDLSNNALNHVESQVFASFKTLRRLDLSSNELHDLDKNSFDASFPQVERLKLANNSIAHIFAGAFDHLQHLKYLDISLNPLVCDCDLIWLLSWSSSHGVKLQPAPKCEAPPYFKGTLLKKLRVGLDLHCESPLQPLLELIPKNKQMVFEGDELILKCRAPRIAIGVPRDSEDLPPRAHVFWGWSQQLRRRSDSDHLVFEDPTKVLSDVYLETKHTTDSGILHSILRIEQLTRNHTGLWDCTLRSPQANLSQTVGVIVISKTSEYCNATELSTNKGVYYWPRTLRGEIVQQQCAEEAESTQTASYECGNEGNWLSLNIDSCPYISETTRILEQFSKVNLTLTKANAVEIARRLHNFTQMQLMRMRDPMDLEFLARTLLNFLENNRKLNGEQHEIAYLLLDIVSLVLKLPFRLFYAAQQQMLSSMKFLKAAEWAAGYLQLQVTSKTTLDLWPTMELDTWAGDVAMNLPKNLFIEYFNINNNNYAGICCYWQRHSDYTDVNANPHTYFKCSEANDTFPLFEQYLDAAIQIPMSLLNNASLTNDQVGSAQRLMLAVYANAHLMPHLQVNRSAPDVNELLTSPVLAAQLINWADEQSMPVWTDAPFTQLAEPVMLILRMRPFHQKASAPTPAVWNPHVNAWETKHCHMLYSHRGLLLSACNRFGYYGLLQRSEFLNVYALDENAGAAYRHVPTPIYIGSGFLFMSLAVNIVTYISFGRYLRINRQQRHALINNWLALAMLCIVFTLGIFQTSHFELCQLSGLLIHYFSLCVLLWLCVSMSALYKRLSKQQRFIHMGVAMGGAESVATDHTQHSHKENMQKPILGVYLVGWGIALLICGISSAVNMREYASYAYCFFQQRNTLNALFVPSGLLVGFLFILFMFSYYQLKRRIYMSHAHQPQFSDNTEHIDLDWLDQSSNNHSNHNNNNNVNTTNRRQTMEQYRSLTFSHAHSSIVDDYERSQLAHLRAYLIFLILYIVAWWAAAGTVVETTSIYEESMLVVAANRNNAHTYGIVYALSCALLSLFMLIFYTLSRNDACNMWRGIAGSECGVVKVGGEDNERAQPLKQMSKIYNNSTMIRNTVVGGVANLSVAYKAAGGIGTDGSVYSNHPHSTGSRSNSQCSSHKQRTNSVRSNERQSAEQHLLPSPQMFNQMINNQQQQQQQQQRLLVSSQDIPNADLFYNPNQINVARKFFKKQKRLAKRNNFELQRQLHQNYDDTSDISSLTGGSDRGRNYVRGHNALTLLSGGGRKVNNTNIYYGGARGGGMPNVTAVDDKHLILNTNTSTPTRLKPPPTLINNMIANIYTNIPETSAPQHEIIKMRGLRLGAATPSKLAADVLSEHDEDETSGSIEEHAPLYENTKQPQQIQMRRVQHIKATTPTKTPLLIEKRDVEAMNSLGLPEPTKCNTDDTTTEAGVGAGEGDEDEDDTVPLGPNDIYISNSLQITHCVNIDDSFPLMTLIRCREQQQSKSLNNINDIFNVTNNNNNNGNAKGGTKIDGVVVGGVISATVTTLSISKSSDNIQKQEEVAAQKVNQQGVGQIAKCGIEMKRKALSNASSATSPNSGGGNVLSEAFYEPSITPCVLSASPTNESDLNYQNSELSIRSHDVYAPQADNELNLTLTDDFPPYLGSSNTSDGDDENVLAELVNDDDEDDDDDENENVHNDCAVVGSREMNVLNGHCASNEFSDVDSSLLTTHEYYDGCVDAMMNTSIDELYEAIKRRPIVSTTYTTANTLPIGSNNNYQQQTPKKTETQQQSVATNATTIAIAANLNETLEDDSSQSSVISYIDPKLVSSSSQTPSS